MTHTKLKNILKLWGYTPADAAKLLCIQKSKISEYLKGENNGGRKIPCYISNSINAHNLLSKQKRNALLKERLL